MNLNEFLKLEQDDILNIPYKIKVNDKEREISQMTVGRYIKIHPYLIEISKEDIIKIKEAAEKNNFENMPELFERLKEPIFSIIKIVFELNEDDILTLTFDELFTLLVSVLYRLGFKSFTQSIIAGDAISRSSRQEIIAAEKFLTL